MKKSIAIISFILGLTSSFFGQHMPINTQYMYHGLLVNPAVTGSRNNLTSSFSYRNQWMGSEYAPKTMLMTVHTALKNEKIAIGSQVYKDDNFLLSRTGIGAYAAYRIINNDRVLSFGTKVGVYSNNFDYEEVNLLDQNDPNFTPRNAVISPGVGFGVYYRTQDLYLGASIPEIINGFDGKLDQKVINYNVIAGYNFMITERINFLPNLLLRKLGDGNVQPDFTLILRYNKIIDVGLISRLNKTWGACVDVMITPQLQVGYSFDYSRGINNPVNSLGNHEISLSYEVKKIVKSTNTKFF